MAKGLAVISGSNSVVFKALENGNITLGQDIAANVVVSGSLKLEISGYGADKFLMSDASGSASWVTIQASQVATSDGSDVQTKLDEVLSGSNSGLGSLETRLSQEEDHARSAEQSLGGQISTEISSLISGAPAILDTLKELADALGNDANFATTIIARIDSEESARESAVTSLEGRLSNEEDDLDAETSARESADVSLTSRISIEESVRASADTVLSNALDAEESSRISADGSLTSRVADEEAARASHDLSLAADIADEASARTSVDNSLEERLSAEEDARASHDVSLASDIAAEESRAESVEASLEARISSSGDGNLSAAYSYTDQKVADLIDLAPTALDTLNELAAALGDDPNFATTVLTRIGDEELARASADTSLEGKLSTDMAAEESARISADGSLTSRISAEEVARASAVSAEESARVSADNSLEEKLDAEVSAIVDNTITFQGTANEVEIVSGSVVTLGDASSTVVLGLPDNVVVSSSLNVTGDTTLGVGPVDDQLTINSKMRITHVDRTAHAAVLTEYADTAALSAGDFDGHMFYLKGDDVNSGMFQQGNKWYFCENGVWHSSFFYVGS